MLAPDEHCTLHICDGMESMHNHIQSSITQIRYKLLLQVYEFIAYLVGWF
jgi:hypothetical protein